MRIWINKQLNTVSKQSRIAWLALIVIILGNVIGCKKEESTTNTTTSTTSGTPPTNTITISDLWALGNGTNIGWIRQEKDMNGNWVDWKSTDCNCITNVIYYTDNKQCVNPLYLDTNLSIHKNVNFGFIKDLFKNTTTWQYWKYSSDTLFEFVYTELNGSCLYNYNRVQTYKIVSLSKLIMELRNINDPNNRIYRYRKE